MIYLYFLGFIFTLFCFVYLKACKAKQITIGDIFSSITLSIFWPATGFWLSIEFFDERRDVILWKKKE